MGHDHLVPYQFKKGHRPHQKPGAAKGATRGLGRATRKLVGDDGEALIQIWWSIANDPMRRDSDRLEASKLLADRGWGKAASFTPQEGDPLGLEDAEDAAAEFRSRILRLAPGTDEAGADRGGEES